jgi:hypothetical protein
MLASCSAYSSILKMEAMCSFETSVGPQQATGHYIPENSNLINHHSEDLNSYKIISFLDLKSFFFLIEFLAYQQTESVVSLQHISLWRRESSSNVLVVQKLFRSMGIADYVSVCVQLYCMLVFTVFHYMFRSTWPSSSV